VQGYVGKVYNLCAFEELPYQIGTNYKRDVAAHVLALTDQHDGYLYVGRHRTHRYAETKLLALQRPSVKTAKPLVSRMMMHMKSAK
jgi:hypothetical protein